MIQTYIIGCTATTQADAMLSMQLPRKGRIVQIESYCDCALETDSYFRLQVAVNRATGQWTGQLNTPTNVLHVTGTQALLTTSGISNSGQHAVSPCSFPVAERDSIYLHGTGSASNGVNATIIISVEE